MGKFNGIKINKVSLKPYIKNYVKDNKLFMITFYGLFLAVFIISLFIVINYESELTHKNYYRMLMNGEYGYFKITLQYFLFNMLFAFCAMLTYRKKYAFAIMYFVVTFIAYRLAVNIVGSWDTNLLISILNAVLFYFMIYLIFVITIVTIICYISKNYLYCSGNCPITLKKMIGFTLIISLVTGIAISIFTAIIPLIISHILF